MLADCDKVSFFKIGKNSSANDNVPLARFTQMQTAGRSMQQLGSDVLFEHAKCSTYCCRRSLQLASRSSEAAFVYGCDEDLHRVDTIHLSLRVL
ncbi:hypothetical protein Rhsp01_62030 [Rhizobium sp. NBRC 114257]|uniref:Uncharacterized protein n=1 Tax=Rhizobium dioscoreae TaxID=2653122 RepID=A0ABQ0ZDQ7_9HYPH|nr:hypothetical protein RsS93_62080 [Rhizobium dioscoreae]GLU85027.1 hypothetical protein Rhsp01_62030 [Rhizobium sp. NBRC 114257]